MSDFPMSLPITEEERQMLLAVLWKAMDDNSIRLDLKTRTLIARIIIRLDVGP